MTCRRPALIFCGPRFSCPVSLSRCGSAGEIFDPNSFLFYPITEERSGSALYAASPMGKIVEDGSGGQDCIKLLGLSEIEGHSQATFAACVLMNATQDVPFWSSDGNDALRGLPRVRSISGLRGGCEGLEPIVAIGRVRPLLVPRREPAARGGVAPSADRAAACFTTAVKRQGRPAPSLCARRPGRFSRP